LPAIAINEFKKGSISNGWWKAVLQPTPAQSPLSMHANNTDLVSVLVQSALRLIALNSYSPGIYHCMISSTAWTKLK
jgi:hypothetical protein